MFKATTSSLSLIHLKSIATFHCGFTTKFPQKKRKKNPSFGLQDNEGNQEENTGKLTHHFYYLLCLWKALDSSYCYIEGIGNLGLEFWTMALRKWSVKKMRSMNYSHLYTPTLCVCCFASAFAIVSVQVVRIWRREKFSYEKIYLGLTHPNVIVQIPQLVQFLFALHDCGFGWLQF